METVASRYNATFTGLAFEGMSRALAAALLDSAEAAAGVLGWRAPKLLKIDDIRADHFSTIIRATARPSRGWTTGAGATA